MPEKTPKKDVTREVTPTVLPEVAAVPPTPPAPIPGDPLPQQDEFLP